MAVDQRRVDAHVDGIADEGGGADETDDRIEVARGRHVLRPDPLDALVVDVGELDPGAEGDRGQNRHLRRGVRPGDILGRIGLRVPEPLGLGKRLVIGGAGLHLGEDEVRRPVHDSEDTVDVRDDEGLPEHLDHRDRSTD